MSRHFHSHGAAWPWDMGGLKRPEISTPMGQGGHGTWGESKEQTFLLPWGRMAMVHGRALKGRNFCSNGAGWPLDMGEGSKGQKFLL